MRKPRNSKITAELFETCIEKITESGCWIWMKYVDKKGYGFCNWQKSPEYLAHRLSYVLYKGNLDKNLDICHTCDNPSCVNPDHLFAGTHLNNMQDMMNKGRLNTRKGSANNRSKLTDEQVLAIRRDTRSRKIIAAEYRLEKGTVSRIRTGKSWSHL